MGSKRSSSRVDICKEDAELGMLCDREENGAGEVGVFMREVFSFLIL